MHKLLGFCCRRLKIRRGACAHLTSLQKPIGACKHTPYQGFPQQKLLGLAAFLVGLGFSAIGYGNDDGLVGSWRFDRAAATIADRSGHGHNARVSGGKLIVDGGKPVLALDGQQRIEIPASPDFDLQANFSIELKIKIAGVKYGQSVVFRDDQYVVRVDPPHEGSRLSFFPRVSGQWESRASCQDALSDDWVHVVATWDGRQAALWVNALPWISSRTGKPPAASKAPLTLVSQSHHGAGVRGAIEYAKIYRRVLTPREIMAAAYNVSQAKTPPRAQVDFQFAQQKNVGHWTGQGGATVALADNSLVVYTPSSKALVMNSRLNTDVSRRDWINLRMAVDKGRQARLVFITSEGAGTIGFDTRADGKPHDYAIEAWQQVGWGGDLLALGIMPADEEGCTTQIERVQVGAEPLITDVHVHRIFSEATLPRAACTERIVVRIRNEARTARNLTATLTVPEGVALHGAAAQPLPALACHDEREIAWEVEAARPLAGEFKVVVAGADLRAPATAAQTIAFAPALPIKPADYVPVPVPAKTKYTLWTHYCALWKTGTHWGWSKIEPWPERKPVLGWYNDGDPEVADWHIKYMVEHGISGVVYCWYRTNINAPVKQSLGHALHDGLLKARYLSMIKFGIMWENGCGAGIGSVDDLLQNVLPFWIDNYFSHPSYARIDGKPVLYVWVPRNLRKQLGGSDQVRAAFTRMRAECQRRGLGGLYLVACMGQQNQEALQELAADGWDASSAYGNLWKLPSDTVHAGHYRCAPYEGFVAQQAGLLQFKRDLHLLPDIAAMMMGWDARPWHDTGFYWADNTPEKFRKLCLHAKAVMDSAPATDPTKNHAIFCCWNEFGEGHYIEPTRGKGFSYLDVIRDVFCAPGPPHVDLAPRDISRAAPESWYLAARDDLYVNRNKSLHETSWAGAQLAGWKGMMGLVEVGVQDGLLRAKTAAVDSAFRSPGLELRASRFTKVIVEMRADKPIGATQLFWATRTAPRPTEGTSVSAPGQAPGRWQRYVFDVGQNSSWGGCVTSLRLDPATAADVAVEIKSIRLE